MFAGNDTSKQKFGASHRPRLRRVQVSHADTSSIFEGKDRDSIHTVNRVHGHGRDHAGYKYLMRTQVVPSRARTRARSLATSRVHGSGQDSKGYQCHLQTRVSPSKARTRTSTCKHSYNKWNAWQRPRPRRVPVSHADTSRTFEGKDKDTHFCNK